MLIEETEKKIVKVRRTLDNKRVRPDGSNRHDPFNHLAQDNEDSKMINNNIDLEWMSINYRKERAAKLSPSKRRMVLVMFQ